MTWMQSTILWARERRRRVALDAARHRRWLDRLTDDRPQYWPELAADARMHLQTRLRLGAGGRLLAGRLTDSRRTQRFWIKWCPGADPAALACTAQNLRWWRAEHPELARPTPQVLAYWPDEEALLLTHCPGQPLAQANAAASDAVIERLARWLNRYARGRGSYGAEIDARLGAQVHRTAPGDLQVDPGPLVASRLEAADAAAEVLARAGLAIADRWRDGLDPDELLAQQGPLNAGFVHGDFKPGNVLVHGTAFHVIDWWIAPCVSWPLTDVATFVANLRMQAPASGPSIESRFLGAYFQRRCPPATRRTLELLTRATALPFIAQQAGQGWMHRRWCAAALNRVLASRDTTRPCELEVETLCPAGDAV